MRNLAASSGGLRGPEHILGVHSRGGDFLGYFVADRTLGDSTWGGMTIGPQVALFPTVARARSTTLQLETFGIQRGSHACGLVMDRRMTASEREERREAFLDAIRPIVAVGLCRIVYTVDGDLKPDLAQSGLGASASAAVLAALDRLDVEVTRATVTVAGHRPAAIGVARACGDCGMRVRLDASSRDETDVLLVDAEGGALDADAAADVGARVVVALDANAVTVGARERLEERGTLVVSETLATAGALIAVDLRARGLSEDGAVARTFSLVADRARRAFA
jgi:hypothetical protein